MGSIRKRLSMLGRAASAPVDAPMGWPAGHFYSPIPSLTDVARRADVVFAQPDTLPGIDLDEAGQERLAASLSPLVVDWPAMLPSGQPARFGENPNFNFGEAAVLMGMLRCHRPRRVIEIGSGHSSAAMLDVDDAFLGGRTQFTFIEPYPALLESLLRADDRARVTIVPTALQEAPDDTFASLAAGDILFVDSTHVSKIDSDVNHLLFRIFPQLAPGVLVHVHDIYWPFEYPRAWVEQGRAWNEAYILRAFLSFNTQFRIRFFSSWFGAKRHALAEQLLPAVARQPGSSLWLERVG